MLTCVKIKQMSSFFSLLGSPDFTEADRLQMIIEPKVTGHCRGLTVQTRKLIPVEEAWSVQHRVFPVAERKG